MKFSKRDFFKAITGGAVATDALLNAAGNEVKELDLPRPEVATTAELQEMGRGFFSVVDAIKYDRIRFDAAAIVPQSFDLFAAPLGRVCSYTGKTKTIAYTNMYEAGFFGAPIQFWLKRINIFIDPGTQAADARTFGEYGWRFRVLEKQHAGGSCAFDARCVALADILAGENRQGLSWWTRRSLEFEWSSGLYIPSCASFGVNIASDQEHELEPMGAGLDVAIAFEGLEVRPIQ